MGKVDLYVSAPEITDTAWSALQDAFDLQVHVEPDVVTRRTDDVEAYQRLYPQVTETLA